MSGRLRAVGATLWSSIVVLAASTLVAVALSACGGPASFCDTHECISSFSDGNGSIVQCADGEWSHSGGVSGACSYHGGVR